MSAHIEGQIMPALPVHALNSVHSTTSLPSSELIQDGPSTDLTRSASYTYIPALETGKDIPTPSIKRTFSENVLPLPPDSTTKVNELANSANLELFRRASRKAKRRMSSAIFSLSPDDEDSQPRESRKSSSEKEEQQPKGLRGSVTGTIRSLARKSWVGSSSRSSSPVHKQGDRLERNRSWSPAKAKIPATTPKGVQDPMPSCASGTSTQPGDGSLFPLDTKVQAKSNGIRRESTKIKSKPGNSPKHISRNSSSMSLKSELSNEKSHSRISLGKVPPLPASYSSERLATLGIEVGKKKDPLWSAFRALDGEYASFQSKTSLQKAKLLRTTLQPFLIKYAQHPSNQRLRAEDLDRRVAILNKWWTGLLEMLHGTNNQAISGTDRPAFLESATMIMLRPEWRVPGITSVPGESPPQNSISKSKSTNSLESEEADFLVDTIHQNVRNTFVQNLLSQMAFVIEKLSLRAAPASLVTFAGKACAYAFFFCPGVADMLVRSWRLPSGTLRRIFTELGISHGDRLDLISSTLTRHFPPPVRSLSVSSQASLWRHLQQRGQLPPGWKDVSWGPNWVTRWSGRDSDLFFSFTKQYHLLISEFLPEDIPMKDRAGVPGLVPVWAQTLVVLETTIYRQAGQNVVDNYSSGAGYRMEQTDAMAPLPMTMANASRSIAENRLIILLRDVLGDTKPELSFFRSLFMGSFDIIIKAATRNISLYNNEACFVICDFMEEVLPIMLRYRQSYGDTAVLDWPFWLQVWKRMMQSHTSLTQIRLIAFLYSTWSILILNEDRKRDLVLDWLLDADIFERNFCHWSPMVRHYFYRLLCWKMARYDGEVTELDLQILETLALRLNKCWAHYQYLAAEAEMRGLLPPSSAPCSPAPNRVLVILRTDSQPILSASRTNFANHFPSAIVTQGSPYQNHSSVLSTIPSADEPRPGVKKRWSLFRGLNVFGVSPGNNRPGEVTPPGSPEEIGVTTSSDSIPDPNGAITAARAYRPVTPPHQPFSFKFSLEMCSTPQNLDRRTPNRELAAPQLPHNAETILRSRQSSESSGSGSSTGSDSRTGSKVAEVRPLKPQPCEMNTARYSGRALAEWTQVLNECRGFYARRKQEGVPRDHQVETPTMGVETFRLIG
ncbi:hypothetical protein A1O1_03329 [Capronia coronata CBS 617.96]|uniref:DUF1765-domain-containing protein n=1 Tax=Capronia coronata CBS 617.96 TaxID=1182541 RepID=W9YKL7_9EURO|nr:uncharacterized protein A1O1_03329 [Capronia coronata CBS 617.96]EXJ90230.1 hypothetical protein A1O1_03329 [Capronia coronata CBS 617.96]